MAFVVCSFCSLVFGLIALWSFKRKDPMHFWSGITVKPEEIADIPAYNRANGMMWALYALAIFLSGVLTLFSESAGAILLMVILLPGLGVLIFVYYRIYNKYKTSK